MHRRLTPRTKAVIPVHFAGLACDCERFEDISRKHGVSIVYDAAHAVSTKFRGVPVGGFGRASCYSFQSNKNLTTLGEGGAVTTDDPEFAETVRQMKTFGFIYGNPARVVRVGFNYRMTKPQLAVGLCQLAKIDGIVARKRANFISMNAALEEIEEIMPAPGLNDDHGSLMHVVRLRTERMTCTRDEFAARLKSGWGVGTVVHYPAVWNWEVMKNAGYSKEGCSEAEKACKQVLSLPVFATTTADDIAYIAYALKETVASYKR